MRVIWISLGLSVIFLIALFAYYEPQQDQALLSAGDSPAINNPFVEEKVADIPAANQEVDLAVLPAAQNAAPAIGDSGNVAVPVTASEEKGAEVVAGTLPETDPGLKVSSVVNKPAETLLDNGNAPAADKPVTEEKEEKKLGLAMIAFEKEKQKNKVAVIVHETNSQKLTEKEIKALYLDRMTRWEDGSRVMLYDLPLGDKYRDKFSQSILNMTALEADKQESKRRELRIKANDVEVKAKNVIVSYVEQHPNAVAYVPLNLVREKSSVKIVLTIP